MSRARRISIGLVLATVAVAIAAFSLSQSRSSPFTNELPSPNGYEELVRAGQDVGGKMPREVRTAGADELRPLVESNQDALASARDALNHESRVPINPSTDYLAKEADRLAAIRKVARVLLAEGRLAEQDARHRDALKSYLDVLRVGSLMARGGLLLHLETRSAYETAGLAALERLRANLGPDDREHLLDALEALEAEREPFDAFAQRESEFLREVNGWWASVATAGAARAAYSRVANTYAANSVRTKQLMVELRR